MPTVTKTGHYHVPPDFDKQGFWNVTAVINGAPRVASIFVSDPKFDKHSIGSYWPAQQHYKHSGITLDEDQFEPLYKQFGIDIATAYLNQAVGAVWIELEYKAKELPHQYFRADVKDRDFFAVQSLKVGGSVGISQNGQIHVFINHGPY